MLLAVTAGATVDPRAAHGQAVLVVDDDGRATATDCNAQPKTFSSMQAAAGSRAWSHDTHTPSRQYGASATHSAWPVQSGTAIVLDVSGAGPLELVEAAIDVDVSAGVVSSAPLELSGPPSLVVHAPVSEPHDVAGRSASWAHAQSNASSPHDDDAMRRSRTGARRARGLCRRARRCPGALAAHAHVAG